MVLKLKCNMGILMTLDITNGIIMRLIKCNAIVPWQL